MTEASTVVLGAGLCGLSAAFHLQEAGRDFLLLEREDRVGGLARTETYDGFSFDRSIHILYSRDAYATELICDTLMPQGLTKQARRSYCYTGGVYTEYPYQSNNYGLPARIIFENLRGLIEAKRRKSNDSAIHFEDWIVRTFGSGIAKNFMIPYNERQWAWDLKQMSYDWIADRVPMPRVRDLVMGTLRPAARKQGPNREFWYPSKGGIESLARAFAQRITAERVWTSSSVTSVDSVRNELTLADGRCIRYQRLISTLPIPSAVTLMGAAVPDDIRKCAAGLRHNVVHTINIGFEPAGREPGMHWVYYPENDTVFHRIGFPGAFSEWMLPRNSGSVQAEISESVYRPCDRDKLIERTLSDLKRVGILNGATQVQVAEVVTLNPAYIIYDLEHAKNTAIVRDYFSQNRIDSRGRFGEWEYFNMDHAILSGKAAAEAVA